MSIRSIVRVTGVAKNTVTKLLGDLGAACAEYQDAALTNLRPARMECDEIWSFCYSKQKNVPEDFKGTPGYGDVWTWVAIDADTKLAPSWLVGERTLADAYTFIADMRSRIDPSHRIQLTTDGLRLYIDVVDSLFRDNIDYSILHKLYGADPGAERTYSPSQCIGIDKRVIAGRPDLDKAGTSFVERQNLDHADGDASVHPADQRLLKEGREPRPRGQPALHALQLLPATPNAHEAVRQADYAGDGSGNRSVPLELYAGGAATGLRSDVDWARSKSQWPPEWKGIAPRGAAFPPWLHSPSG